MTLILNMELQPGDGPVFYQPDARNFVSLNRTHSPKTDSRSIAYCHIGYFYVSAGDSQGQRRHVFRLFVCPYVRTFLHLSRLFFRTRYLKNALRNFL